MSEDPAQHPREITLELIFRRGQPRILGELGQIREKQDEIITRLARVEREVVDLRRDILGLHRGLCSASRAASTISIGASGASSTGSIWSMKAPVRADELSGF